MMLSIAFWSFSALALVSAWRVFMADSMVRAAYWLLVSFVGVALIVLLFQAEFLGLITILMMTGEMTIMAVFMVMFMMNPAGLNPMQMVHQHRASIAAGVVAAVALAGVGLASDFPDRPAPQPEKATEQLGTELLGDSMLIFQSVGVALLATMIGAVAIASRRGRFGEAYDRSLPPDLVPPGPPAPDAAAANAAPPAPDLPAGETGP